MENRRVVARLMPETYRGAELRRLTGFFGQVRDALADLAAPGVEDPRVVVLTPGRLSETAFDQAHIASLLGLPLVTGDDLVMRDGRLWTRDLGGRRQVDVVLRRVDDTWCDPLELRPDSELGVPGPARGLPTRHGRDRERLRRRDRRVARVPPAAARSCARRCSTSRCCCRPPRPGGAATRSA